MAKYRIQSNIDFDVFAGTQKDAEREAYETLGDALRSGGVFFEITKMSKHEAEAVNQDRINNQISY